jgi:hypothetical protein
MESKTFFIATGVLIKPYAALESGVFFGIMTCHARLCGDALAINELKEALTRAPKAEI